MTKSATSWSLSAWKSKWTSSPASAARHTICALSRMARSDNKYLMSGFILFYDEVRERMVVVQGAFWLEMFT